MNIQHIHGVPPLYTNTFLIITNAKHGILIDAAAEPGVYLKALDEAGATLTHILLTHGHYDHTGAVAELSARWPGVPVYLNHRDQCGDDAYLRQLFPPVPGAKDYGEGDTLSVGGLTVSVLTTPGHSEGSVTLRCGDVLFCGDTLFAGSCGRTDFPGGSVKKMMESLKRLGGLEGDLKVCPGHMEDSTLDRERSWNPYLRQAMNG